MKKNKKVFKLIIIVLLLIVVSYFLYNLRIKNIYVEGNTLLTDQEIIELANIENYPKVFKYSNNSIIKKIKMNPIIKDVKVNKNLFGKISITIEENNLLLKNQIDNTIYLSNLKTIPDDNKVVGIPSLTNYVEENILNDFLSKLNEVDKDILRKISEITYAPSQYDKDLFLLYMNDLNYVYITTKRLLNINNYDDIALKLEGKKGILYLDSGNHFEILD